MPPRFDKYDPLASNWSKVTADQDREVNAAREKAGLDPLKQGGASSEPPVEGWAAKMAEQDAVLAEKKKNLLSPEESRARIAASRERALEAKRKDALEATQHVSALRSRIQAEIVDAERAQRRQETQEGPGQAA